MSGRKRDILDDIHRTTLELITDFRDNIFTQPAEQGDIMLVEFFFKKMNPVDIAERIVLHVLPFSQKIKDRDISFFIEKKNEIFGGLPKERVEYFASLIEKPEKRGGMSDENKEIVFSYFDTLDALGQEYKKNK